MGKAVKHFGTFTQSSHCSPVIFLVKEKACFLSISHINHIFYAIFNNLHFGIKRFPDKTFNPFHAFIKSYLGITSLIHTTDIHAVACKLFFQTFDNIRLKPVNSEGKGFDYKDIRKFINNDSRKIVRFTEDKTAG